MWRRRNTMTNLSLSLKTFLETRDLYFKSFSSVLMLVTIAFE
ncbi:unnamed protein product, partial [Brassica oleracea var. botrytis]